MPSDEDISVTVTIILDILVKYGNLISRVDELLTVKERRCKVAECAFGLLEGVKGLSCYALVALVYTCDINHSLDHGKRLEFVLSVFISKFTANRRSEFAELRILKVFFTSSTTQDKVD